MPRWLSYVVLVIVLLVALAVLRAVLRARRRHVRREVIDDRLDVPDRPSIVERLGHASTSEAADAQRLVTCGSCGHRHPYTSGLRSGDVLLIDCPGCGRRTNHDLDA